LRRHGGRDRAILAGPVDQVRLYRQATVDTAMAQSMQAAPAAPIQATDASVMTIDPNAAPIESKRPVCAVV
jgi:hypothetical protein